MLSIVHLRAGLSTLLSQQLVLMGLFFALPVYLQVVLGLDALETGLKLLSMSITMFIAALLGPRAAGRRSPRTVARVGLVALAIGAAILLATLEPELRSTAFAVGLAVFGFGVGLLASQLGNVIMSSVVPAQTNQAGGLQGTAQNLGASLGTALIGSILIGSMTSAFITNVTANPAIPPETASAIAAAADASGLEVVPVDTVPALLEEAGIPADQAQSIADDYAAAQMEGLRIAIGGVAVAALLALWFTPQPPGPGAGAGAGRSRRRRAGRPGLKGRAAPRPETARRRHGRRLSG